MEPILEEKIPENKPHKSKIKGEIWLLSLPFSAPLEAVRWNIHLWSWASSIALVVMRSVRTKNAFVAIL